MSKPEIAPESRQSVPATNPHSRGTDTTNVEPRASQVAKREGLGGRVLASSEARQVSSRFLSLICKNNPGSQLARGSQRLRQDAVERWALVLERTREEIGLEWPQVRRLVAFSQRDPIWRNRVIGVDDLIENIDLIAKNNKLRLQMRHSHQITGFAGKMSPDSRAESMCSSCGEVGHKSRNGECSKTSVAIAMASDPTVKIREIADALGMSVNAVAQALSYRGLVGERKMGRPKAHGLSRRRRRAA